MLVLSVLLIFPLLMAFAASSDLFTMTIPNQVSIALIAAFICMAAWIGMPFQSILMHLACGAAILALTFSLFCFGWIGGGDAKLAAATALWLGWSNLLDYGIVASLGGAVLTIALMQARRLPLPPMLHKPWILRLHDAKGGIPYGIALAAAGLVVYPQTQVWLTAIGH